MLYILPQRSTMTRQNLRRLKICLLLLFEISFTFFFFRVIYFFSSYTFLLFHNIRTPFNTISTYTSHTKTHTRASTLPTSTYMQYAYFCHTHLRTHAISSQTHHAFRYTSTCSVMTKNRFILIFFHSFSSSSITALNTHTHTRV